MLEDDKKQLEIWLAKKTSIPKDIGHEFIDLFKARKLQSNEFFLKAGESASQAAFVISGILREYYITDNGSEYNKYFVFPGNLTGSYFDLLSGTSSTAYIQALSDCRILVAPYLKLVELFDSNEHWQKFGKNISDSLFMRKAEREYDLMVLSPEKRFEKLIKTDPDIFHKIPQYHIASYLGLTPVGLSRIKKRVFKEKNDKY